MGRFPLIFPVVVGVGRFVVIRRRGSTGAIDREVGGVADHAHAVADAIMYRNSDGKL